jgi:hypothetical protein
VIWLSIDLVIVAGWWFAVTYVKPRYPGLWKEHFVGEEKSSIKVGNTLAMASNHKLNGTVNV